ncbi:MAG: radical SAM protein [Candidatus Buchananbacteria bacterium]
MERRLGGILAYNKIQSDKIIAMKILLMTPINRSYVVMPSLGLGYLASITRECGHEPVILHSLKDKISFDDFEEYLRRESFDIIGIQMFTFDITPVKKHLAIIKKINPRIVTVLGGAHPSGDPENVLNDFGEADFAFRSEAEIGWKKFLELVAAKRNDYENIPNLIWRSSSGIEINQIDVAHNLDELSFPAWDLMDPRSYPEAPHGGFFKSFPTAPIIITRGCPMTCTFCAGKSVTTRSIRLRSAKNVIDEMIFLRDKFGVHDFLIEDENFTLHRDLVIEFCRGLIDGKTGVTWSCPSGVRLDTLDSDMLKLMEESGCHSLSVGVEFGSQRIHDLTKKHLNLEIIRQKVALFKDTKIKVTGFFMFGIPGETKAEMLQTIRFAKELHIDRAQFNNFMPLPGTEIYKELNASGKLAIDHDHFFVHDVGYVPAGMTREEMKDIQRSAYLQFYLRPKIIWGLVKEMSSLRQLRWLIRRFMDALS